MPDPSTVTGLVLTRNYGNDAQTDNGCAILLLFFVLIVVIVFFLELITVAGEEIILVLFFLIVILIVVIHDVVVLFPFIAAQNTRKNIIRVQGFAPTKRHQQSAEKKTIIPRPQLRQLFKATH